MTGPQVHPTWQILTLHYLALRTRPSDEPPAVTFASLPAGKTYAVVYENRVNRRLCAGVGKDGSALRARRPRFKPGRSTGATWPSRSTFFPAFHSALSGMPVIRN